MGRDKAFFFFVMFLCVVQVLSLASFSDPELSVDSLNIRISIQNFLFIEYPIGSPKRRCPELQSGNTRVRTRVGWMRVKNIKGKGS